MFLGVLCFHFLLQIINLLEERTSFVLHRHDMFLGYGCDLGIFNPSSSMDVSYHNYQALPDVYLSEQIIKFKFLLLLGSYLHPSSFTSERQVIFVFR